MTDTDVQAAVQEKYGAIAKAVAVSDVVVRGHVPPEIRRSMELWVGWDVDGRFASAFVRARKPEATSCCGPDCCA
jgi:hypothetical protein